MPEKDFSRLEEVTHLIFKCFLFFKIPSYPGIKVFIQLLPTRPSSSLWSQTQLILSKYSTREPCRDVMLGLVSPKPLPSLAKQHRKFKFSHCPLPPRLPPAFPAAPPPSLHKQELNTAGIIHMATCMAWALDPPHLLQNSVLDLL